MSAPLYACLCIAALQAGSLSKAETEGRVGSNVSAITLLVTVNDTWKWDPPISNDTCMVTIRTGSIFPNTPLNKSANIMVGDCDNGPLVYTASVDDKGSISVMLTFHSSVIEDASPPTCTITWDNQYNLPTQPPHPAATSMESLIPGCSTADSREGYHMTNYWFYILYWSLSGAPNEPSQTRPSAVVSVTFLVAVNRTEDKCIFTSMTPALKPGESFNQSKDIHVGNCDHGPLLFNITQAGDKDGTKHTYIDLTFHSHAVMGASPPSCKIKWDYNYLVPAEDNFGSSLLPGCSAIASRESSQQTYYWFYAMDWAYG